MEEAFKRLLKIIELYKMNPKTFCSKIEFGYSTFKNYQLGIRPANSLELYFKVLYTFVDIRAEWLMRGEGNMLKSEDEIRWNIPISDLLNKIDSLQEKLNTEAKENGRLIGRIEELEKRPVSYKPISRSLYSSMVAEKPEECKESE